MKIDRFILDNLLRCNKHIKIEFIENSTILEIKNYNLVICTLNLPTADLNMHADIIYNIIVNLKNINLYIPKIYQP